MSVKTIIENAQVQKGTKKSDGGSFYFVEVLEPVRKYINPDKPQDAATLDALATTGETISQLTLHQRNRSLVFSSADLA
ncbi:hypothetical protein [Acinetobacter baumannii]|uniref:hypothetical protein n=1 Tax=Acinetobacter baumannii TaxID=470 RepID=UPI0007093314|nr:hypothetical protein [Acinetobacter baumannii]KQK32676.1 hypothetical protein AQ481_20050 [Acinetobacter baumannii]KUI75986.1 hypothetical protein AQ480_19380 [Acinetobacter baumannii]OFD21440.1 hypothetical protein A1D09_17910 [Acinetobacter baumannii]